MTADTTTPLLALLLQGTGNNNNAWGQNLNDQVISKLDTAIAGSTIITGQTGGTYTLSPAEALSATLFLFNTLTSDLLLVVPNTDKIYNVVNFNSGAGFFTQMRNATPGANGPTTIPAGSMRTVISVSGNIYRDRNQAGTYVYSALTVPADALECDGTLYKRASLPELFGLIGTTFGSTDSTNFAVPDAKTLGRFLRSRTGSVAAGTTQANQNKSHTHTGSGTTATESATHTHTGSGTTTGASVFHTHTGSGTTGTQSVDHTHTFSGTTATESVTHTHPLGSGQSVFITSVQNGTGANQGNVVVTVGSTTANLTTGTESATHTHTYSGTTSGVSSSHTHTFSFTTSTDSVDHTHSYSFTTATESATHTHTYSFTTSTGSSDGTEARPESLVGILCIRY